MHLIRHPHTPHLPDGLRDKFAMAVLPALYAVHGDSVTKLAEEAYAVADAMVVARDKSPNQPSPNRAGS